MTSRTPRSGGHGLFSWAPADGELQPDDRLINPLTTPCPWPACHAPAGAACTTNRRRRAPHPSRIEAANKAGVNPR